MVEISELSGLSKRAEMYVASVVEVLKNATMLQMNGSLAKKAIRELVARGLIRMVSAHSSQ